MIGRQRDIRATSVYDGLHKASSKLEKRLNCREPLDYKRVCMRGSAEGQ
jgi:hypothetical protein